MSSSIKYTKIENIKAFIGEVVGNPISVSSIKGAIENVEIAGTIRFFNQKSFVSKRKDKEGNEIEKFYYSFTLIDNTGKMNCVYFPLKTNLIDIDFADERKQPTTVYKRPGRVSPISPKQLAAIIKNTVFNIPVIPLVETNEFSASLPVSIAVEP